VSNTVIKLLLIVCFRCSCGQEISVCDAHVSGQCWTDVFLQHSSEKWEGYDYIFV